MYDAPIRAEVISLAFYRWTSANGLCKMQSGAQGRGAVARETCGGCRVQNRTECQLVQTVFAQSAPGSQGSLCL
jgi:hypothetical protein